LLKTVEGNVRDESTCRNHEIRIGENISWLSPQDLPGSADKIHAGSQDREYSLLDQPCDLRIQSVTRNHYA
jgi:hypothetical protein